ncbi:MAG TPA: ergothioneine biosynthesis protein EgtC [Actinomycetota bacterium]|nr:ergothioneine biosynthesis protein EgtC [Actinomycetota bacterium]
MCRLLAYLGPETSLESLILTPAFGLLKQSYEPRFQRRGRINADGFGVGWYQPDLRPEPARYRRAVPLWSDRSFASFAGVVRSGAILASVRNATPPSPSEESSTGPFLSGRWLFAHNGEVAGYTSGARERLLAELTPARARGIEGTADSEVLFALALDRIDAGATPAEALAGVVTTVLQVAGGRLNMILTDGSSVAATAFGDSLYLLERSGAGSGRPAVIIASEPFDDLDDWVPVADGSLVQSVAGRPAETAVMAS